MCSVPAWGQVGVGMWGHMRTQGPWGWMDLEGMGLWGHEGPVEATEAVEAHGLYGDPQGP